MAAAPFDKRAVPDQCYKYPPPRRLHSDILPCWSSDGEAGRDVRREDSDTADASSCFLVQLSVRLYLFPRSKRPLKPRESLAGLLLSALGTTAPRGTET